MTLPSAAPASWPAAFNHCSGTWLTFGVCQDWHVQCSSAHRAWSRIRSNSAGPIARMYFMAAHTPGSPTRSFAAPAGRGAAGVNVSMCQHQSARCYKLASLTYSKAACLPNLVNSSVGSHSRQLQARRLNPQWVHTMWRQTRAPWNH